MDEEVARLREALKWYAEEAAAISRYMKAGQDMAVLASVTVLANDGGSRAEAALKREG